MQDHKQHRDNIKIYDSAHQLNIVPILIGSQQTQHVKLHKDDLDHVVQLIRSKHEAHSGEDNHLATAMDPLCNVNNTNVLEHKIVVFSLVATTHLQP
jgi:hypothetical protein